MPVWTIIDLAYVQGVQELNIFNKHTARLKMANIAQVVNVLQAMILTKGPQMLLTPTYHVFRMYSVHQNATYVPAEYDCERLVSEEGRIMDNVRRRPHYGQVQRQCLARCFRRPARFPGQSCAG